MAISSLPVSIFVVVALGLTPGCRRGEPPPVSSAAGDWGAPIQGADQLLAPGAAGGVLAKAG